MGFNSVSKPGRDVSRGAIADASASLWRRRFASTLACTLAR
jgi:hypothetical protein